MKHPRLWRLAAVTLALVLAWGLAACYGPYDSGSYGGGYGAGGGQSLADMVNGGLTIQAERGSKTLDIQRALPGGKRPADLEKDTWTVFVYLCGSDLESEGAAATRDMGEMVGASGSDQVQFVVQTGGASKWRNSSVSPRKLGRYLIQNGSIMDVGSTTAQNMGDPQTLADFLDWGIKNFPAEHMAVILWDHGGGSIAGVCFDELNRNDSLSVRELDQAFATAFGSMWDKFEFVGFDACLMSTLETANVLATYADYMIASQESEPSGGWEYSSIVEYLALHPSCTGAELGREICDTYLASVDRASRPYSTLSVVDLSQIDGLMQDFYRFSQEMYASGEDQGVLAAMTRGIKQADSFGGNNWREGYTNMVDLGGLVDACAAVTPSAAEVQKTLDAAVAYQIRGNYHADASGLSTYYPLKVNTSKEFAVFQTVAVNPSYLSYVDRLAHGSTYGSGSSQYQQYTGDTFWQDSLWNWLLGNATEVTEEAEDNWDYVDEHTQTSEGITFAEKPQVDEEGTYWFQLDAHGIDNAAVVSGVVYEVSEDGSDIIALGETYDVYGDWETGEFADGFDGMWLALPDGQSLNLSVQSATEDHITYTSPIELNGKECYLRMVQDLESGDVEVEGAWSGVSAEGAVDRGVTEVKRGDVIVPLYKAYAADTTMAESSYEGEKYTVDKRGLTVDYGVLPDGAYLYSFAIEDTFGDYFFSESAKFEMEDGTAYFYE